MSTDRAEAQLALTPARSYHFPGGPTAKDLAEVQVNILSEVKRGSDQDRGIGSRR